jgi:hypothetical protein
MDGLLGASQALATALTGRGERLGGLVHSAKA